jgi:riboflavin transporter FmnP
VLTVCYGVIVAMNRKVVAFVAVMGALGNVLGLFGLPLPAPIAQGRIELHFSQLPPLLVAFTAGPIPGAVTGFLSLILETTKLGNPFVPLGNAILAGVAGLAARRLRPLFAGLLGEVAETPYLWGSIILWVGYVLKVPLPAIVAFTSIVNVKAFLEVAISCVIIEIILSRSVIRERLAKLR